MEYVNNFVQEIAKNQHLRLEQDKNIFHDFIVGRPKEATDMTEIYSKAEQMVKKYINTK